MSLRALVEEDVARVCLKGIVCNWIYGNYRVYTHSTKTFGRKDTNASTIRRARTTVVVMHIYFGEKKLNKYDGVPGIRVNDDGLWCAFAAGRERNT